LCENGGVTTAQTPLLAEERREAIARLLEAEGTLRVTDVARRFGVSDDTARRDLWELEQAGRLRRVHGGALRLDPPGPAAFVDRRGAGMAAKVAVAEAALGQLRRGELVVLSGGSTVLALAERVPADLEARFVVTSPEIAVALLERSGGIVDLVGGRLDARSHTVTGSEAVDALRAVRPDAAIVSACSVHPEAGLTLRDRDEAAVVRAAVTGAGRVVALATAEKLGTAASYSVAELDAIDVLVTDAPKADCAVYRDAGVEVLRA
jgi:DeoR/GlpR family transcriptional regulator of sugar metabolism